MGNGKAFISEESTKLKKQITNPQERDSNPGPDSHATIERDALQLRRSSNGVAPSGELVELLQNGADGHEGVQLHVVHGRGRAGRMCDHPNDSEGSIDTDER